MCGVMELCCGNYLVVVQHRTFLRSIWIEPPRYRGLSNQEAVEKVKAGYRTYSFIELILCKDFQGLMIALNNSTPWY